MKLFPEYHADIDLSGNVFDVDGFILLLTFLNVVLMEVDIVLGLYFSHFITVHAGAVFIVDQGRLIIFCHL